MNRIELFENLNRRQLEALVESQAIINRLEPVELLDFLGKKISSVIANIKECLFLRVSPELDDVALVGKFLKQTESFIDMSPDSEFSLDNLAMVKELVDKKKDYVVLASNDFSWYAEDAIVLLVPLIINDKVECVVVIEAEKEKVVFTEDEISFCLILKNLAEMVFEKRLADEEREKIKHFELMHQVWNLIAHEMRNPITVIGGFAQRLAKLDGIGEKEKNYVSILLEETEKLEGKLNALLRFSKKSDSGIEIVNLNAILKNVLADFENKFKSTERIISFRENLTLSSLNILANKKDLEDAFSNLLAKAAEPIRRRGKIYIETRESKTIAKVYIISSTESNNRKYEWMVQNPFFYTDFNHSEKIDISQAISIIESFSGKINFKNEPLSRLSIFEIQFPYNKDL